MLTQPPMLRYRHIAHIANQQLQLSFPAKSRSPGKEYNPRPGFPENTMMGPASFAPIDAPHQGNYATIDNYLEMELRYMDAGKRGPKAPMLGHQGHRVNQ